MWDSKTDIIQWWNVGIIFFLIGLESNLSMLWWRDGDEIFIVILFFWILNENMIVRLELVVFLCHKFGRVESVRVGLSQNWTQLSLSLLYSNWWMRLWIMKYGIVIFLLSSHWSIKYFFKCCWGLRSTKKGRRDKKLYTYSNLLDIPNCI